MAANLDARILLIVLAIGFLLAGCSSSDPQLSSSGRHRFKPGQPNYTVAPYQINGVWYHPKADYSYDETGTASWYGPGFDGKMTSDGEIYDMNGLTAAHKTLPLPSVVQVTNLQNGRALQLRVNDRGPFVDGRIIDLSRRAERWCRPPDSLPQVRRRCARTRSLRHRYRPRSLPRWRRNRQCGPSYRHRRRRRWPRRPAAPGRR